MGISLNFISLFPMKNHPFSILGLAAIGIAIALTSCGSDHPEPEPVKVHTASGGALAYFAGGCFWCIESDFEHVAGVSEVVSGYGGADMLNPTYENHGDHAEIVEIRYDPSKVTYAELVDTFWKTIDPFAVNRQFCDSGRAYRSAIFYSNATEQEIARSTKTTLEKRFGKPIATEISAHEKFWIAEGYHQDYYKKNPLRYKYYRNACGRDNRVKEIWGDEAGGLSSHYQ